MSRQERRAKERSATKNSQTNANRASVALDMVKAQNWPFGSDPRTLEAYLRSLDDDRGPKIQDFGHGIRVYPSTRGAGAPWSMVDAGRRTCSNDFCREISGFCAHIQEDDFRFGKFKGQRFVPPASMVVVRERKEGGSSSLVRNLPRPNPTIDGRKAATIARKAREVTPTSSKELASELARWARYEDKQTESKRNVGRPATELYDLAVAAALRAGDKLCYESLASHVRDWANKGYVSQPFHYNRLVEAMQTEELSILLDRMCMRVEQHFRDVTVGFGADGVVFSTYRTDNQRRGRIDEKAVQVTCHSLYEIRWGLLVGFRLTFSRRGRGSGEAPQFPYIVRMAKRTMDIDIVLADGAFGSDRNFALADAFGFRLLSPINPTQFDPRSKKFLSVERAVYHLTECNALNPGPLFATVYPHRNRIEGWHEVVRDQSERYLVCRLDRSHLPPFIGVDQKKNPASAYAGLPDDQDERDRIIETEQFVGWNAVNEFQSRRLALHLRALVRAWLYYKQRPDFFVIRPFEPRPEDEAYSLFRPVDGWAA